MLTFCSRSIQYKTIQYDTIQYFICVIWLLRRFLDDDSKKGKMEKVNRSKSEFCNEQFKLRLDHPNASSAG